jgi:hypothetical protein
MAISFIEWVDGIFEIVKLTELMGCLGKDKSDRTAKGLFSVRDHPFDRVLSLTLFSRGGVGSPAIMRACLSVVRPSSRSEPSRRMLIKLAATA